MPMNEEVRKAVRYGNECWDDGSDPDEQEMWQTIRAELTRLTEIADQYDPLVVRLHDVTTKLEAANAFLRECHCYFEARGVDSRTIGESLSLNEKIQAHLSENGHAQQRAGGWGMKLRTEMLRGPDGMTITAGYSEGRYSAREHDAACAHALKQAEREADALFNASTRWFRARAWINTRASELMREWGFDRGEVE